MELKIVLILNPQDGPSAWVTSERIGWKHALEAYGYPFEIKKLLKAHRYPIAIMPTLVGSNRQEMEYITRYVQQGGHLVVSSWKPALPLSEREGSNTFWKQRLMEMLGINGAPRQCTLKEASFSNINFEHPILRDLTSNEMNIILTTCTNVGFDPVKDAVVISKIRDKTIETPAIVAHNYGDGTCVFFNFKIGSILTHYENDMRHVTTETQETSLLPRKQGWTQGECHILKQIMKNTIDYLLLKNLGCIVRMWQGMNAAKSTVILTHDVDSYYGWSQGISNLRAEEERRGLRSTWYVQADSKEYSLKKEVLFALINKGHEIGLHGTDSYQSAKEMRREARILTSFCPQGYKIKTERQHYLRRIRLSNLNDKNLPTHFYEAKAGFTCTSTLPVYSKREPHGTTSGVKGYLPYRGIHWSKEKQSLVEAPTLIIPLTLQDTWIEKAYLEKLRKILKSHQAIKIFAKIFKHAIETRFLKEWKEIFDYCYNKNVAFCLLTHPDHANEKGTGSPDRAQKIYGSFLDYIKSKDRVCIPTATEYVEWWKTREEIAKNLKINIDKPKEKVIIKTPKIKKQGITILIQPPNRTKLSSMKVNNADRPFLSLDGNKTLLILPRSQTSLTIELTCKVSE